MKIIKRIPTMILMANLIIPLAGLWLGFTIVGNRTGALILGVIVCIMAVANFLMVSKELEMRK